MPKLNNKYFLLDVISWGLGCAIACLFWLLLLTQPSYANNEVVQSLAVVSPMLIFSAVIGAVGSYLAFGDDKKFPPTSASIGHVLLNFGAGVFLTRGSLELMGQSQSSADIVVFTSFLWASVGYFILRILITFAQSPVIQQTLQHIFPHWFTRILGVNIDDKSHKKQDKADKENQP